jgi:hypothetical protein
MEDQRGSVMDAAEFWAIRAGDSEIENPISPEKLNQIAEYCEVRNGTRVLEIGCGKAWLLRQWAEQYEIEAVGMDINTHFRCKESIRMNR